MFSSLMLASLIFVGPPECGVLPNEKVEVVYREQDLPKAGRIAEQAPQPRQAEPPVYTLLPGEEIQQVMTVQNMRDQMDAAHRISKVEEAWKTTKGKTPSGRKLKVGVIDTGAMTRHRDLAGQIKKAKSFIPGETAEDGHGHGTHVAGLLAAAQNDWGTVGTAPEVELYIYKALSNSGASVGLSVSNAVREAIADDLDLVNMSLGSSRLDPNTASAIAEAQRLGIVFVIAAGNDGPSPNTVNFPGALPDVFCVASHNDQSAVSRFSSRGPQVLVIGFGETPIGPIPGPGDGLFAGMAGTSMAAPKVCGKLALGLAQLEHLPKTERYAVLRRYAIESAMDLPPAGRDTASGFGQLDAAKLVRLCVATRPKNPTDSTPMPPVPQPKETVIWSNDKVEIIVRPKQ